MVANKTCVCISNIKFISSAYSNFLYLEGIYGNTYAYILRFLASFSCVLHVIVVIRYVASKKYSDFPLYYYYISDSLIGWQLNHSVPERWQSLWGGGYDVIAGIFRGVIRLNGLGRGVGTEEKISRGWYHCVHPHTVTWKSTMGHHPFVSH